VACFKRGSGARPAIGWRCEQDRPSSAVALKKAYASSDEVAPLTATHSCLVRTSAGREWPTNKTTDICLFARSHRLSLSSSYATQYCLRSMEASGAPPIPCSCGSRRLSRCIRQLDEPNLTCPNGPSDRAAAYAQHQPARVFFARRGQFWDRWMRKLHHHNATGVAKPAGCPSDSIRRCRPAICERP